MDSEIDLELHSLSIDLLNFIFQQIDNVDESEIKPYVDDCVDYFNGLYDDINEDITSEDAGDHEYDSFFESISNQFSALIETIKEYIEKVESEELKNSLNSLVDVITKIIEIAKGYLNEEMF